MKKSFFTIIMMVASIVGNANAQELNVRTVSIDGQEGYFVPTDKASATTASYLDKKLTNIPYYQGVDVERRTTVGDVVYVEKLGGKGAEAFGHGIEIFAGAGVCENTNGGAFITPEVGLRYRHDWRWVSVSVGAYALSRQYNSEAIQAGERYFSYGTDATFHVNFLCLGQYEHVFSVYGQGGYLFGKHRKAIEELNNVPLIHNGSGLTFGGGIEYRWQIHATGNALTFKVGYKHLPNTFVNNTKKHGLIEAQIGFNFGIKRHRTNNL